MKFKPTALLAAALLAVAAAPASAQAVPDRIKRAGKLVIATMPNYPPITFKDPATNTLKGVDIELGEAIAKELGLAVEWQEIAFAQMLPSLQTGRVDTAMAGMSDLASRRETVDFVNYMKSGPQFYTVTALASQIRTPEDLCGRRVGASRSTNYPKRIEDWSQANCVAKGKPAITVIGTEGSVDARTQLKTERLDGAVQGNETLPYLQSVEPNTFVLLGEPLSEEITGIPFPKTETALRDAVKGALERLQANGTYDRILANYGLQANALKPIAVNQGK